MSTTTTSSRGQRARTAWRVDPERSTAEFRVRTYWGLITVNGRFKRLDGSVARDGGMELIVDATSLDTGNARRDRHLRSPDFFAVDLHRQVRFRSTSVEQGPDGQWRVTGELEAAGRCVRLELTPSVSQVGDRLEIDAQTIIDQRQLGMTYKRFGIRTPATVTVHACLRTAPSDD